MGIHLYASVIRVNGLVRRPARTVVIGGVALGGAHPIVLQSMTTTNTNHTGETIAQCIRIVQAGGQMVRCAAQGVREAHSLRQVKLGLEAQGFSFPLIADIHFNPKAALEAVKYVDKVRINPGNYADRCAVAPPANGPRDYALELERMEELFVPLVQECKRRGVAMRIGVNHGSLSRRIMERYGDTPLGMAESAMEFLRVCVRQAFHAVVVSMKSSNTRVMVQATRQLVLMMEAEGMDYPLHLGVTEAGEGEDGRMKSAVGIGALLADGMGDTIRVSLTEPPEMEIPVARALAEHFRGKEGHPPLAEPEQVPMNPTEYTRRATRAALPIGGQAPPVVVAHIARGRLTLDTLRQWGWAYDPATQQWTASELAADYLLVQEAPALPHPQQLPLIGAESGCRYPLIRVDDLAHLHPDTPVFVRCGLDDLTPQTLGRLREQPNAIVLLQDQGPMAFYRLRASVFRLMRAQLPNPCIVLYRYLGPAPNFQLLAAAEVGPLFLDGLADGLALSAAEAIGPATMCSTAFGILQAARARFSRTEYIACPGCGRTLFDLHQALRRVKEQTQHLKGLKIAVMGCIVNGPGEMADADYGYVGAGPGRINLYRGKELVKRGVAEGEAVVELLKLIAAGQPSG